MPIVGSNLQGKMGVELNVEVIRLMVHWKNHKLLVATG